MFYGKFLTRKYILSNVTLLVLCRCDLDSPVPKKPKVGCFEEGFVYVSIYSTCQYLCEHVNLQNIQLISLLKNLSTQTQTVFEDVNLLVL